MFIELHIIQNFAPSNLNRSDTGSPKDCEFGGVRRARVSSQCFKRAIRREGNFAQLLEKLGGSVRTRRLVIEIAKAIEGKTGEHDVPTDKTVKLVSEIFKEGGIERPEAKKNKEGEEAEKDNTKLILFMNRQAITDMAAACKNNLPTLNGKDKEARTKLITELGEMLAKSAQMPDIALFGRMVEVKGSTPFGKLQLGVDAACQVAHAISTHKSGIEFDFYTAVDDLLPKGETGAGMMGTMEFNSACFYRYANVDMEQLKTNLKKHQDNNATNEAKADAEAAAEALALDTLEAFLRAAVEAVPTGKQTGTAAQNPPSFVLAVARGGGLWSLANAFEAPVRSKSGDGLVAASISKLDGHWAQLVRAYGGEQITDKCYFNLSGQDLEHLNGARVAGLAEVVKRMRAAVKFNNSGVGKEQ
jgi:CRISPR system Cascade subunit CasC